MKSYFPDLNVWVAMAYRGHQHHAASRSWFDSLESDTAGFCRITQIGFLRLLTNPMVMGDEVKTQAEAWQAYDHFTSDSRVVFCAESGETAVEDELRRLTTTARSTHQQFPDAYLVAFARAGGMTLVTFDRALSKIARKDVLLLK
jgi:toxin-antitoxin system PIN domain toxin